MKIIISFLLIIFSPQLFSQIISGGISGPLPQPKSFIIEKKLKKEGSFYHTQDILYTLKLTPEGEYSIQFGTQHFVQS